jgi:hypothetical protein
LLYSLNGGETIKGKTIKGKIKGTIMGFNSKWEGKSRKEE